MRRWFIIGVSSIVLMGCEVMEDIAWSENTFLQSSTSGNGMYIEQYQTDTYDNFTGAHVGSKFDFYVTNNRSKTLCFRLDFASISADNYHYREIYRIEPGQKTWVGYASIFFRTSGHNTLRVKPTTEWGWIDSWQNCQTNLTW